MESPGVLGGGNEWRVRFSPPVPGDYKYHAESTDKSDPDLNGHEGSCEATGVERVAHAWTSQNERENHHYFEYADGTPFLWLGDAAVVRAPRSLDELKTLAADRHAKGFNVVQIIAGLVYNPTNPRSTFWKERRGICLGAGFRANQSGVLQCR